MAFPHFFDPWLFVAEFAFSIIAVLFCFLIFFRTKESYELTKHRGIRYFRNAFLFFGLSYVMRFLFNLVLLSGIAFDVILPRRIFWPIFMLPLAYFSTIGICYLVFSLIWKNAGSRALFWAGNITALALLGISFITRSHYTLLLSQSVLIIFAVILSGFMHTRRKKLSRTRILYFLVALLWLLNLWVLGPRRKVFSFGLQLLFELISIGVFWVIYAKVIRWAR
ncbi:hypothetical protein HYU13_01230 [Candidatus Woesearchaeota archaeon]|nr:hypothetical protein [Candidatus Woesearchaeota archaeon]